MKDIKDCRILVVDDAKTNIDILLEALHEEYRISVAMDGAKAIKLAHKNKPDLILLDIMMPDMDGYEVARILQSDPETADIPIIFLTAMDDVSNKTRGFDSGAVDYITKPFEMAEVKVRAKTHLDLKLARETLKTQNEKLEQLVQERTREIIIRLAMAAEYRDTDTGMHIMRIRDFTSIVAQRAGVPADEAARMGLASTMHDVGKIGIPDSILLKPARLTASEWKIMKTHCEIGAKILTNSHTGLLETARVIALNHHERWDGSGYPHGLKGEDIPLGGRICCLADVFDALTSKRPYKEAWPIDKAVETIVKDKGKHFDPDMTDIFVDCLPEITAIYNQKSQTEQVELASSIIEQLNAV
jgi:putative two-component system response regulator